MCQSLIWGRKKDGIEERKKAHGEYQELVLDKWIENIRKKKHLSGRGESKSRQVVQETPDSAMAAGAWEESLESRRSSSGFSGVLFEIT